MTRAWNLGPEGKITPLARNKYLVEFGAISELYAVIDRGVWSYRNEVVAPRQAQGPESLITVSDMEVWVQMHHVLAEAFTEQGLVMLAGKIGTPISEVREVFINGDKCYKIKVKCPIKDPLKDRLITQHPELGGITILLVYEKVQKVCVGHEMTSCVIRTRVSRLKMEGKYREQPGMEKILDPKLGPCITNAGMIPRRGLEGRAAHDSPCQSHAEPNKGGSHVREAHRTPLRRDNSFFDLNQETMAEQQSRLANLKRLLPSGEMVVLPAPTADTATSSVCREVGGNNTKRTKATIGVQCRGPSNLQSNLVLLYLTVLKYIFLTGLLSFCLVFYLIFFLGCSLEFK
jgi:Domain of unknown function (DUF4283)